MPQTVLGLDIGHSTIKAVLLTPGGLTSGRVCEARTLNISDYGTIEEALKKLAEDKIFCDVPCCLSLPLTDIILRNVSLPFRDESRIRKTLAFELEPLIPLPIEDVVTDYLMIPRDGLLVAALAKKCVREWIENVEANLGEVSLIDLSAGSLAAQILHGKKSSACGIILDIGHSSTTASFYEDEALVHVRPLAFGGEHITQALAEDLGVTTDKAEQLKIGNDYPESSAKVGDACRLFCSELQNTIEYMKINGILQSQPSQITVTGGGSLFVPLCKELENYFSLSVEVLDLIRSKQLEVEENIGSRFEPRIMNTAIAAAMRMSAGKKSFNFRQGEFEAKNSRLNTRNHLRTAAIAACVIFLLAVVNQILDYSQKTRELNGIKKQISRIFKKSFPEAQAMVDPLQQMKTKLAEDKKAFGFAEGVPEATTIELLKEIFGLISPSLDIVITDLSYENRVILMKGETKTIDNVTAVKNELLKSRYFKDVSMGSTSLTKDGGKVAFNLRIEVK